jgi:leucyl-tRNA synthetase
MFGAPPESDFNFDVKFLDSMKSFLDKIERADLSLFSSGKQVPRMYELMTDYETKIDKDRHFHVAIARLMELNNLISKHPQDIGLEGYKYLLIGLYPFVPHLSSELWERHYVKLGATDPDIRKQQMPDFRELLSQSI